MFGSAYMILACCYFNGIVYCGPMNFQKAQCDYKIFNIIK